MKSKGLGDSIEKFTKATGIKLVVDTLSELTGIDCGCVQRKERLNALYPSNSPEMSDEVVNEIWIFLNQRELDTRINPENKQKLFQLYKVYIDKRAKFTNCTPCVFNRMRTLREFFKKD